MLELHLFWDAGSTPPYIQFCPIKHLQLHKLCSLKKCGARGQRQEVLSKTTFSTSSRLWKYYSPIPLITQKRSVSFFLLHASPMHLPHRTTAHLRPPPAPRRPLFSKLAPPSFPAQLVPLSAADARAPRLTSLNMVAVAQPRNLLL
jgi:hypothetical protein